MEQLIGDDEERTGLKEQKLRAMLRQRGQLGQTLQLQPQAQGQAPGGVTLGPVFGGGGMRQGGATETGLRQGTTLPFSPPTPPPVTPYQPPSGDGGTPPPYDGGTPPPPPPPPPMPEELPPEPEPQPEPEPEPEVPPEPPIGPLPGGDGDVAPDEEKGFLARLKAFLRKLLK